MRMRVLAAVAVFAAALLAPSAAFADPVLTTPAGTLVTKDAPINFVWSDAGAEDQFRIVRGDLVSAVCPTLPSNLEDVSGILPNSQTTFGFTPSGPSSNSTLCYYAEGQNGVSITYSDPVLITYDTLPPTGAITSPSIVNATTDALTASASDDGSGVFSVAFERWTGTAWTPVATDLSFPYTADWDTVDGVYLVHAIITDNLGNPSFTTPDVSLRIDRTHPTVSVTAPATLTIVRGANVTVSANASDSGAGVTGVEFFAQGSTGPSISLGTTSVGNPYSVTWNTTTGFPDGLYSIWAVATDGATLTTTSSVIANVRVDNTSPTGFISVPTANTLLHGTTGLTASASDVGGVASVAFEQSANGGVSWNPISTDSSGPAWTASWDTTPLNGVILVHAVITDLAGNPASTTAPVSVNVDNAPPTVTLGGVTGGQNVRGLLPLSANADDGAGSGVSSVQFGYRVAGTTGSYQPIGGPLTIEPFFFSFDTSTVSDGLYEIRALATDVATNANEASFTNVRVDNTKPATPAQPTGLTPVSASPTINFAPSSDGGSGINHYDVFRDSNPTPINGSPIPAGGPYTAIDSGVSAASTYVYTVVAVDNAGNKSNPSPGLSISLDPALSAPTSVTALATPTNQHPQFSWVAPAAFTVHHYEVYRGGAYVQDVTGSTTFTDNAVSDGAYVYQVRAINASSVAGVTSAPVTIVFDTTAPIAPTGVAASAALDGSIAISWTAASDGSGSGIARYVVRRSQSSLPPASVSDGDATCQGTATSCTDATALNGKLYSYAVFAIDRAGNTSLAGVAPAVTASDQLAPAKPQGLTATASDASVVLKWAAAGPNDDVAGYVLVAKQGTQPPGNENDGTRVCPAIVATSTTCVATGLTNGASYTFGLFALDEALNRSLPAVVTAAPNGKVTDAKAPAAVSNLRAKVSGHKVTLTWKNPADHDFDHVEITAGVRKPAALKASKRVYSGKGTKATTTLAPGQSRWFVVVAYDAVGNASAPASVHVTIAAASKFGPAPRARVHGKVKLSWPLAKRAKYYNVQVYAGKKRILDSWPAGRALQLPRAKLKRGTTYTWYVWPGLGAKAKAHYGKLIGKNVFTFTG
jgi:fibronectin type 3 domain-containing protein